jgi:hypothetical protein
MTNCCGGLTLERWREVLGYHPYHFWNQADSGSGAKVPVASSCNALVREYAWQNADAVGRDDIRRAIDTAVQRLTEHLDYSPYPRYFEEVIALNRASIRNRCVTVRLRWGRLIDFGVEAFTALTTDNLVTTVSDSDGDGLNDMWSATFDGTTYDLEDTYIYPGDAELPFNDRATVLTSPECKWLRQARRWQLDEDGITVTSPLPPMAQPLLLGLPTQTGMAALDPASDANYLQEPRFYTRSTNSDGITTANAAVIFEYDNPCGCGACSCDGQGLPYTRLGQAVAWDRNSGEATLYAASYDAANEVWNTGDFCGCGYPDRVRVRYYAGDEDGCRWDEVVARLAAAELARPVCGCTTANRELGRWQADLARAAGANDDMYVMSPGDLDNPLGTRRGQVYAWQRVKRLALTRGFAF